MGCIGWNGTDDKSVMIEDAYRGVRWQGNVVAKMRIYGFDSYGNGVRKKGLCIGDWKEHYYLI